MIKLAYLMAISTISTLLFFAGMVVLPDLVHPYLPQQAQATVCPIDQVQEQLDAANTAYNEQNYIEVKNNLDSIQELVDSVKEEE